MSVDMSVLSGARLAFDLDGTLVDTAPDLVRALNEAVAPDGLGPVPIDAVRAMVGRGARALIERAYMREGKPALAPEALDERLERFLTSYRAGLSDQSRIFDGVEDALNVCAEHGAVLSVCTNKPTHLAVPLLEQLGLAGRFVRITGPEDTEAKKPDGRHLETAIAGKADYKTVLIGDSEPDVLAAANSGAGSIVFTGGYSEKPVHALGADRLFESWIDLPELIAELITERNAIAD